MKQENAATEVFHTLDDCPLPVGVQYRNIFCFVLYWCVFYLCSPVTYIGTTHSNLLRELGNNNTIANLPSAAYQWLTLVPVIVAWLYSHPKYLKPMMLIALGVMSSATILVVAVLWFEFSASVRTAVVIFHGAAFGASNGVLITGLWDALRRGVSTSRRGVALGYTFGCGPLFACVGSLMEDGVFDGKLVGYSWGLHFPMNYLTLFAAVAPLLLCAGAAMMMFTIPPGGDPEEKTTAGEILEGLKQFLNHRVVWFVVAIYVIVYSGGNAIFSNVSLYARDVLGESTNTLGIQSFLRFGCKAIAGGLLGLLLSRASPRATLIATTCTLLIGMIWALNSTGWWFMATFGLLGAGELFGAYFPNYLATASNKKFVRLNMAYLSLLSVLIGFSSVLFGWVSKEYGLIQSFYISAGMLTTALILIAFLPANPSPRETGERPSDDSRSSGVHGAERG